MDVDLEIAADDWAALDDPKGLVTAAVRAVYDVTKEMNDMAEVVVKLASDAEVAKLNKTWRDKPYPTNVLAFPIPLTALVPDMPQCHGDIVLAGGVVAREAHEQGKSLEAHTSHLVAHGMLHLLGYDHDDEQTAERMEALEIEVMAKLGFPDPYRIMHSDDSTAAGAGKTS